MRVIDKCLEEEVSDKEFTSLYHSQTSETASIIWYWVFIFADMKGSFIILCFFAKVTCFFTWNRINLNNFFSNKLCYGIGEISSRKKIKISSGVL